MSDRFIEARKSLLLEEVKRELRANRNMRLGIQLDLKDAISIVAALQLALRHPGNRGPASDSARQFVITVQEIAKDAGLEAISQLVAWGDDPNYDNAEIPA